VEVFGKDGWEEGFLMWYPGRAGGRRDRRKKDRMQEGKKMEETQERRKRGEEISAMFMQACNGELQIWPMLLEYYNQPADSQPAIFQASYYLHI
jgi:hypothetical protein